MKVLYLAPSPTDPGRLTEHSFIDEEIRGFARGGVQPFLLSTTHPQADDLDGVRIVPVPPVTARDRAAGVAFLLRRGRSLPARLLRAFRHTAYLAHLERLAADLVRGERINVIHSHFAWPGGLGGTLAAAAAGVPLVASLRGTELLLEPSIGYGMRGDPLLDAAIRMMLRRADRTLYASEFMKHRGIALGADPTGAIAIPKGVDLDHFSPAAERETLRARLGCRGPMLLAVGHLIRRKGMDDVIRAMAALRGEAAATLVICGEGPERQALAALAEQLGVAGRVRFAGQISREEIRSYFAACDVFVLGSLVEAAGNVVLEAMASGRPVVCTDSGGPPEYVRDGESGFVVPVGDATAMADRLQRLLDDPPLSERLGSRGRQIAAHELPYGRMVRDVMEVYQQVADGPRGRGGNRGGG